MDGLNSIAYGQAIQDFRQARGRAALEGILNRLRGHPSDLLSFEQVRRKLHAQMKSPIGLQEIPLDAIVGSVGRYSDFTRSFLPRGRADEQRWARVKALSEGPYGFPPIEVYQVGDVYFVRDGHHRVSVSRDMGAKTIEAYVTEVQTRVPLAADDDPSDLIMKAEYTDFLEATGLDQLRPGAQIVVSEPGKYPVLQGHIEIHRQLMERASGRPVPLSEAAADWYEVVYQPVVAAIREKGILLDFPGRSEADLYLWICDRREDLREALGWDVEPEQVAADLAEQFSPLPSRVGERLVQRVIPDDLESGPPPGQWRQEVVARRPDDRLFHDVLVAIRADEGGWQALEEGVAIAAREGSRLLGLHVVAGGLSERDPALDALHERFEQRLEQAGVEGQLSLDEGEVTGAICRRARWIDLVVLSLAHAPAPTGMARLGSGLRKLIRSCPRPLLAVPGQAHAIRRPLVAYDHSPKAQEALFIGTYMAAAWDLPLQVLSIAEGKRTAEEPLDHAREYLQARGVQAEFLTGEEPVAEAILRTAEERGADLLLLGGYGASPMIEVVLGSTTDEVLRRSSIPMLICR